LESKNVTDFDKGEGIDENRWMNKEHLKLTEIDRNYLEALIRKGELQARAYRRALGILELDRGKSYTEVTKTLKVSMASVSTWAKGYRERGLQVIQDQPRSGRPIVIDGQQRAKITALACSKPPEGYAQWSLRLLADKAVELGYVDGISHTEVRTILKKTN
jgi:transposase